MKRVLTAAAVGGLTVLTVAAPAMAVHEGSRYTGNLQEVAQNDPGSPSGDVEIVVSDDGETMAVTLNAADLGNVPHAMHIHGIVDGDTVSASACPTMAQDSDGDGVVTVVEGAAAYGGVLVSLTTSGDTSPDSALAVDRYPAGESITYTRAGIPIPDELKPALGKLHVVVHGVDENSDGELTMDQEERSSLDDSLPREATLPALCGTLAAAGGTVQTGDGATQTASSAPLAMTAGGLIALYGAAFGLRRRSQSA